MGDSNVIQKTAATDAEPPVITGAESIYAWLAERFDALNREAKFLVDDYWARLKEGRAGKKLYARGSLGVRLKTRETGAFTVEWYEMGILRVDGQRRSIARKTYARGRSYKYPLERMLGGEPEWVAELVTEVENAFADIRRQVDLLIGIRDAVVAYDKLTRGARFTALDAMQAARQKLNTKR